MNRRDPDHHRRSGQPGVRHRRREGDACARSQRLPAGLRHNLPQIDIMDEHGNMNQNAGAMRGSTGSKRASACRGSRRRRVSWRGRRTTPSLSESVIARGTIVEPRLSTQWFMKIKPLAETGDRGGRERRDPLIARQLPPDLSQLDVQHPRLVYLASALVGTPHSRVALLAARSSSHARPRRSAEVQQCATRTRHRRPRHLVLFRPFAVHNSRLAGKTRDQQVFYPTTLLITAYEILFFWVARMIMFGCHFMQDINRTRRSRPARLGRQARRQRSFSPRLHPRPCSRCRSPKDVEDQRKCYRSSRNYRALWDRRHPLHSGGDGRSRYRHRFQSQANRWLSRLR